MAYSHYGTSSFSAYKPHAPQGVHQHVCGLYYTVRHDQWRLEKTYLPQVQLQAHATILATTSRTELLQIFVNPSTDKGIKEVRYTFPLYDGVSVVGFTCQVGDRTIVGEVKEKAKAKAVFNEAVARGETAGLLEQLPDAADVFTTTIGNVPPRAKVIIKITYLGELKHDMEVDGIRFTIPSVICPRYGAYPGTLRTGSAIDAQGNGISITVDAEMADGSFIQKIQSPSHPISMTMGTTSIAPNAEPTMSKASASLTLGTTQLDTDFVVQVIAKNTGIPKAILENHPTIPNHRALMATLVPKFALPAEKPEIVFVCDRSGSMGGSRIQLAIQALKVFLKSLPVGVKFNICSFGTHHSFLWPKSVTYSQQTLDEAMRHAETFDADYGGTEMLFPLQATFEQRYKDMPLDVMMLTDGEIWNQQSLFTYLNQSITQSKEPIRIFTLGIGNGVSHALIEGVAKAGNGFSQTVGEGEKMDTKVVRMLKGALSPHVNDYTLEVKYGARLSDDEDDFEIVEKVADSLRVKLDLDKKEAPTKTPISLFDTSIDVDMEDPPVYDETGEERYSHLPKIPVPRIIQAPQNIPSLFAFNRTTVYLLLGPDAPQAIPTSVVLRGTSSHGPLELEIPIQVLDSPGETIHQLAAKKAISELEQGRGWLPETKDESGALLKSKFEGRFGDMVEREAVRLGVQFQVGGKWCSFVAVESNKRRLEEKEKEAPGWEWLEDEKPAQPSTPTVISRKSSGIIGKLAKQMSNEVDAQKANVRRSLGRSTNVNTVGSQQQIAQQQSMYAAQLQAQAQQSHAFASASMSKSAAPVQQSSFPGPSRGGRFGGPPWASTTMAAAQTNSYSSRRSGSNATFGNSLGGSASNFGLMAAAPAPTAPQSQLFGGQPQQQQQQLFGSAAPPPPSAAAPLPSDAKSLQDYQMGLMVLEQGNKNRLYMARQAPDTQNAQFGGSEQISGGNIPPRQMPFGSSQERSAQSLFDSSHAASAQLFGSSQTMPPQTFGGISPTSPSYSPTSPGGFGTAESMDLSFSNNDSSAPLENFDFDSFLHTNDGTSNSSVPQNSIKPAAAATSARKKSSTKSPAEVFNRFLPGRKTSSSSNSAPPAPSATPKIKSDEDLLHYLISLQTFSGSWTWSAALLKILKLDEARVRQIGGASKVSDEQLTTALVVAVFEERLAAFTGSWELVVEKAREWLGGEEGLVDTAKVVVKGA